MLPMRESVRSLQRAVPLGRPFFIRELRFARRRQTRCHLPAGTMFFDGGRAQELRYVKLRRCLYGCAGSMQVLHIRPLCREMFAPKKRPMFFSLASDARTRAASAAEKTLVPAAWPSGIARFGAVTTCDDCAAVDACEDWMTRTTRKTEAPPPFCPNASALL